MRGTEQRHCRERVRNGAAPGAKGPNPLSTNLRPLMAAHLEVPWEKRSQEFCPKLRNFAPACRKPGKSAKAEVLKPHLMGSLYFSETETLCRKGLD